MAADRVLVIIETAANMAGVEAAKAGIGSFNPMVALAATALGGLVLAGKSAMEISKEHEKAENELAIAIKNRGLNTARVQEELYRFIQTNRDIIANQSDVVNSTAALIREGVSYNNIKRDQMLILDLAAAKNISVAEATSLVTKAEAGNFRGLKDLLGITMETSKAHDTLAQKQKVMNDNLDRAAHKVKGAADAIPPLQKAINSLGNTAHDYAIGPGKALNDALAAGIGIVDLFGQMLLKIGNNDAIWAPISKRLTDLAADVRRLAIQMGIAMPEPSDFGFKPTWQSPSAKADATAGMTPAQYAAYYAKHLGGGTGPGSTGLTPAQFKAQFDKEQTYYKSQLAEQAKQTKLLAAIAAKAPPVIQIYAQPGTQVTATQQAIHKITAV